MSGKNKLDTLVKPIESEEDFNKYLSDGEKVFVIDVHREWCGPCSVMKTNIDKIYIDTDDCEEKINFGSINYDKYKEIVDEYISEENGKLELKIDGCDAPTFINKVKELMPVVNEEEEVKT